MFFNSPSLKTGQKPFKSIYKNQNCTYVFEAKVFPQTLVRQWQPGTLHHIHLKYQQCPKTKKRKRKINLIRKHKAMWAISKKKHHALFIMRLCRGLTTQKPLIVILCYLPENRPTGPWNFFLFFVSTVRNYMYMYFMHPISHTLR